MYVEIPPDGKMYLGLARLAELIRRIRGKKQLYILRVHTEGEPPTTADSKPMPMMI